MIMAKDNTITLFDLQLASGCTISPFVWATKYALKHKGFDIDIVPGGFTGIMERTNDFSPALFNASFWMLFVLPVAVPSCRVFKTDFDVSWEAGSYCTDFILPSSSPKRNRGIIGVTGPTRDG